MHVLVNSATLPRKWPSFSKKSRPNPPLPLPPSSSSSSTSSSSSSKTSSRSPAKGISRSSSFNGMEDFKVPYPPPPPRSSSSSRCAACSLSSSTSSFKSNDWKSRSVTDLKPQHQQQQNRPRFNPNFRPTSLISKAVSHDSLVAKDPRTNLHTASILNKNLRSTSWRNLFAASNNSNFGGMNRTHRLSQGLKKVAPPSVPEVKNPRASISSFGSDISFSTSSSQYMTEDAESFAPSRRLSEDRSLSNRSFSLSSQGSNSTFSLKRAPKGLTNTSITENTDEILIMDDQGIDMTLSPGRDSPGHDSNASSVTLGSAASSNGCRNSTTSLDSGRASNSAAESVNRIQLHPQQPHMFQQQQQPLQNCRLSYQSSTGSGSFRQSYHSSSSSVASSSIAADQDGICPLNVQEMTIRGLPDHEILNSWLTDLHFEEYYNLFLSAGYDMPTISRMTPEDLTAIGIKKPNHRKRLKMEIGNLNIGDGIPDFIPDTLEEWLHLIRLGEYGAHLRAQGYNTVDDVTTITIEDLEDVGIYRLGHQKRFLLAIKRVKDIKSGKRITTNPQYPQIQQQQYVQDIRLHNQQQLQQQQQQQLSSFQVKQQHQQQPKYHPEVIRIEHHPPPPLTQQLQLPAVLPPDMPRPMPPLQMFHHNSFGVPQIIRSYDDADIVRSANDSVLIHHHPTTTTNTAASNTNSGGGTLPRPKGCVKPRPVAKIIAKTRVPPQEPPSTTAAEQDDPKKNVIWPSPPSPSDLNRPIMRTMRSGSDVGIMHGTRQYRLQSSHESLSSSSSSPPPPPPPQSQDCDSLPFANENAGTIRMRSSSHLGDDRLSSYNWPSQQEQQQQQLEQQLQQQQQQQPDDSSSSQPMRRRSGGTGVTAAGHRTAGDVLNDIGSMLADLTDELDAMLHTDRQQPHQTNSNC